MLRKCIAGLGVTATVVAMSTLTASPAWAKSPTKTTTTTGIDVSYAQCTSKLPSGEAFAVVGVNGGLANDYNSCLRSEFAYAQGSTGLTKQARAQTYLNTADPGNSVADWPSPSQEGAYGSRLTPDGTSCGYADSTSTAGADSVACAYVYGYDMVAGITYNNGGTPASVAGDIAAFLSATSGSLVAQPVWLDVETANSWQPGSTALGLPMNVAALQGMVDALKAAAGTSAVQIGVYSTSYQWGQITGGSTAGNLSGLPDWIPGASGQSGAASNCGLTAFTAGPVTMTQWFGHPYDGDYSC